MGKLEVTGPRPPYLQVADQVLAAIVSGRYGPGDRLPTLADLAAEYGVAVGTVKSALAVLRDSEVITTKHGIGSTIRPDLQVEDLTDPAEVDRSEDVNMAEIRDLLLDIRARLAAVEQKLAEL